MYFSEDKDLHWLTFYFKQTKKNNLSLFSWLNTPSKQTDLKGQNRFILLYFVNMWRTLPPFLLEAVFRGLYFPLRTACLFTSKNVFVFSTSSILQRLEWVTEFILAQISECASKRISVNLLEMSECILFTGCMCKSEHSEPGLSPPWSLLTRPRSLRQTPDRKWGKCQ